MEYQNRLLSRSQRRDVMRGRHALSSSVVTSLHASLTSAAHRLLHQPPHILAHFVDLDKHKIGRQLFGCESKSDQEHRKDKSFDFYNSVHRVAAVICHLSCTISIFHINHFKFLIPRFTRGLRIMSATYDTPPTTPCVPATRNVSTSTQ